MPPSPTAAVGIKSLLPQTSGSASLGHRNKHLGLRLHHGNLATGLLECPCDMAAGFPPSRERKGGSCSVFYDLALEATHGHFRNILLISQASPSHWERGSEAADTGRQDPRGMGAFLEASCRHSARIPVLTLGRSLDRGGVGWASPRRSLLAPTLSSVKRESQSVEKRVNVLPEAFLTESIASARVWPSS